MSAVIIQLVGCLTLFLAPMAVSNLDINELDSIHFEEDASYILVFVDEHGCLLVFLKASLADLNYPSTKFKFTQSWIFRELAAGVAPRPFLLIHLNQSNTVELILSQ